MEKYSAFFKRPEVRITAFCIALLVISFGSEIMHWWYTILILAIAIPLVIRYWGQHLIVTILLVYAATIWGTLIYLFPPEGEQVFRAGMVVLYTTLSFSVLFFGGIALISQFVLPVQTFEERRGVFGRLILYILGKHGPALFIRNAKVEASEEEKKRKGHGVVLVDANSAASLQRDKLPKLPAKAVRIIGPGIAFIHPDEKLREKDILDLRKQTRSASLVKALTRDGITIITTITIGFRIQSLPEKSTMYADRNRPAFPFDSDCAFRAIYGHADGSTEPYTWSELPMIIAKETWRDLVSRETVDRLFHPIRPIGDDPLQLLRDTFTSEVKAHPIFKGRGIEITNASLGQFGFKDDEYYFENDAPDDMKAEPIKNVVRSQRIETWVTEWKRRETEAKAGGDLEADRIKRHARIEAQREWMTKIAHIMQMQGASSKRVVAIRLFQALESAASDPSTHKLLPEETIQMLNNVREWMNFDE